jgi:hypothetical protein
LLRRDKDRLPESYWRLISLRFALSAGGRRKTWRSKLAFTAPSWRTSNAKRATSRWTTLRSSLSLLMLRLHGCWLLANCRRPLGWSVNRHMSGLGFRTVCSGSRLAVQQKDPARRQSLRLRSSSGGWRSTGAWGAHARRARSHAPYFKLWYGKLALDQAVMNRGAGVSVARVPGEDAKLHGAAVGFELVVGAAGQRRVQRAGGRGPQRAPDLATAAGGP